LILTIEGMGRAGEGAARMPNGETVFVPFTLPGEQVDVEAAGGRLVAAGIVLPSQDRRVAPCPHFVACGGCAVQHWDDAAYAAWKRSLVVEAMARAGYQDAPVGPLARTPPGARRRMDFAFQRGPVQALGLHRQHAAEIIAIETCAVLHPALLALLAPLRAIMPRLNGVRRGAAIIANLLDSGPDLLIRADGAAEAGDRARLAEFAAAQGIPRIAWARENGVAETVAQSAPPWHAFAGVRVCPPPGAFLQASAQGEAAIVAAMLAGLPQTLRGRGGIFDLFAGIGTLSFALMARGKVRAFEGDGAAAAALAKAAGGTRVAAARRDLARQPLQAADLAQAAAVVLDPPFSGAREQMGPLAAAGVPVVIYVSCNPAVLGRDAAVLRAAGYALAAVTPIDQFLWSAQVEAVAVFVLAANGPGRRARGG